MRTDWLRIAREFPTLVVLLLLAACGGGGSDGGDGGGPASGAVTVGGIASSAVPGNGVASGAVQSDGVAPGSAPGRGGASGANSGRGAASDAAPPPRLPPHVPNEVIVKFRDGVPEFNRTMARSRVSGSRLRVFRILAGLEHHRLPPNVSVDEAIAKYRQDPDVLYAEPNYIVRTTNTPDDTQFGELWGLYNTGQLGGTPGAHIDAPSAWNITTGSSSVVVAVIDTGIDYNHPDLSANMFRNTPDCIPNGMDDDGNGRIDDCFGIDRANNDSDPLDDYFHGTHVAGTIGAVGNDGSGVVGVNWNVT